MEDTILKTLKLPSKTVRNNSGKMSFAKLPQKSDEFLYTDKNLKKN